MSRNLKKNNKVFCMHISKGGVFQARGTANAKALRWEQSDIFMKKQVDLKDWERKVGYWPGARSRVS